MHISKQKHVRYTPADPVIVSSLLCCISTPYTAEANVLTTSVVPATHCHLSNAASLHRQLAPLSHLGPLQLEQRLRGDQHLPCLPWHPCSDLAETAHQTPPRQSPRTILLHHTLISSSLKISKRSLLKDKSGQYMLPSSSLMGRPGPGKSPATRPAHALPSATYWLLMVNNSPPLSRSSTFDPPSAGHLALPGSAFPSAIHGGRPFRILQQCRYRAPSSFSSPRGKQSLRGSSHGCRAWRNFFRVCICHFTQALMLTS